MIWQGRIGTLNYGGDSKNEEDITEGNCQHIWFFLSCHICHRFSFPRKYDIHFKHYIFFTVITKFFVLYRLKAFFSRCYGKVNVGIGTSLWKKISSSKVPRHHSNVSSVQGKISDSNEISQLRTLNRLYQKLTFINLG